MKSESNKIQGQRVFNTTQRQIVNLIVIVVILGVIGEFFYYDSEYSRMQQLVNSEKTEHDSILQRIINFKSSSLNAYTNDYTYWDEMVLFAQNGDTAWAHANIDASLSTYGADYVWVFDSASVLKYFTRATDSGLIDSNLLNVNMLMESSADKRFNHFYAEDIGKIIEISVYTIHPTSDPHRVSEPKGYYAAGKWLSPQYMLGISELTGTGLRFLSEAQEYIDEDKRNDFQVTNFYNLNGSNGNILTQIVSFKEFTNLKSAFTQFRTQLMLTNIVIAVILLGGAFILFQLVNKPLSQINRALAAGETKYIQPLINKENEFGHLAGMINDFFEQKQQLLSEISERIDTEKKMKITENRLKDSLLEKEVLIKEVHHRVKNNLQIIISLIRLQANKVTDQNLHSYLNETLNRIKSIALVHEMLYRSDDLSHIEFKEYLLKITDSLKTIYAD